MGDRALCSRPLRLSPKIAPAAISPALAFRGDSITSPGVWAAGLSCRNVIKTDPHLTFHIWEEN